MSELWLPLVLAVCIIIQEISIYTRGKTIDMLKEWNRELRDEIRTLKGIPRE